MSTNKKGAKHNEFETYSSSGIKSNPLEKTGANKVRLLRPPPLTELISILAPQGLLQLLPLK